MTTHRVVSREEWIGARMEHLAREKELTRLRDQLSRERRALPHKRLPPLARSTWTRLRRRGKTRMRL